MKIEQKKAIKKLEAAFKKCAENGIKFAGMDGSIVYATQEALNQYADIEAFRGYDPVANVNVKSDIDGTGSVNTHGTYQDSGGW